jgi:hypothetical protein
LVYEDVVELPPIIPFDIDQLFPQKPINESRAAMDDVTKE